MKHTRLWNPAARILIASTILFSSLASAPPPSAPDVSVSGGAGGTSARGESLRADGRFLVTDSESGTRGLDMQRTLFSQGALLLRTEGMGTGMILNKGEGGEIYGGLRFPSLKELDGTNWLSLRVGRGGFHVVTNDDRTELLAIDNAGGIYLNGDVIVNGKKIFDRHDEASTPAQHFSDLMIIAGIFMALLAGVNVALVVYIVRHHAAFRAG